MSGRVAFALHNFYQHLHILGFGGSTQVCSNAPKTWQKLLQSWCEPLGWGEGGKEETVNFHLVSDFTTSLLRE